VGSVARICTPSFINIGSVVQNLLGGKHRQTDRRDSDYITLLESRPKTRNIRETFNHLGGGGSNDFRRNEPNGEMNTYDGMKGEAFPLRIGFVCQSMYSKLGGYEELRDGRQQRTALRSRHYTSDSFEFS
jgi:hypothetical protein